MTTDDELIASLQKVQAEVEKLNEALDKMGHMDEIQRRIVKLALDYPHNGKSDEDLRKLIGYAKIALQIEHEQDPSARDALMRKMRVLYGEDPLSDAEG